MSNLCPFSNLICIQYSHMCQMWKKIIPSIFCTKSLDLLEIQTFYKELNPADYKRICTIYKQLTHKHKNISNQKRQQPPPSNFEHHLQQPSTENLTKPRSFTNVTVGHQSFKLNLTPINNNEISFLQFLDEFKSILNLIIPLPHSIPSLFFQLSHKTLSLKITIIIQYQTMS